MPATNFKTISGQPDEISRLNCQNPVAEKLVNDYDCLYTYKQCNLGSDSSSVIRWSKLFFLITTVGKKAV